MLPNMTTLAPPPVERRHVEPTPILVGPVASRGREWVSSSVAFLALVAVTAMVSVVFWPGHMNLDTLDELRQAQAGWYDTWHTPVLSALWRVLILAGLHSPGWVLAGGLLTLLVGFYLLLRIRLSRPWAFAGAALLLVFPPVLGFDVELGTDAWFTAAIVCGFGFASRCARTSGLSRLASVAAAVLMALLAIGARPTAVPLVFVLMCALCLVLLPGRLRGWRRLLGITSVAVVTTLALYGSIVGLERYVLHASFSHPEAITYYDDLVALSVAEHQVLLPADVFPSQDINYLDRLASPPGPLDIGPLFFGSNPPAAPVSLNDAQARTLQHAWMRAILRHPYAYLRERAAGAGWQLALSGPAEIVFYGTYTYPPQPPGSGFTPAHRTLDGKATKYVGIGANSEGIVGGPLQRVWLYVLVLLLVVALALRRGRRMEDMLQALVSSALLLYAAEILIIGPGVQYRYMYPAVTVGAAMFILLVVSVGGWLRTRGAPRST